MASRLRRVRNVFRSLTGGSRGAAPFFAEGPAKVELVSIHIPKSAGTSFFASLKRAYGKESVARVDIPIRRNPSRRARGARAPAVLPPSTRVVHGHFRPRDLPAAYGIGPEIPVITWMRDPVERVISNYFYLQMVRRKRLRDDAGGARGGVFMAAQLLRAPRTAAGAVYGPSASATSASRGSRSTSPPPAKRSTTAAARRMARSTRRRAGSSSVSSRLIQIGVPA